MSETIRKYMATIALVLGVLFAGYVFNTQNNTLNIVRHNQIIIRHNQKIAANAVCESQRELSRKWDAAMKVILDVSSQARGGIGPGQATQELADRTSEVFADTPACYVDDKQNPITGEPK